MRMFVIAFLQRDGDAAKVPPLPTAQVKPSTLPPVCSPDLRTGAFDMGLAVGDIVELVGPDRAVLFRLAPVASASRPDSRT